jgi:pyridoxal phosphate enzyme (YggS family)
MGFTEIKNRVESSGKAILVAVSKTRTEDQIIKLYHQGQRVFGENRVQELLLKYEHLPKDISWHLIGSLQKNKVKYIAPFVTMIHSVDDFELAKTIDKEALKSHRVIDVLLQIKIAKEESKQGFEFSDLIHSLELDKWSELNNIRIVGVMGMATLADDMNQIRSEFRNLADHFDYLKENYFFQNSAFQHISMGMSGDYLVALEEGSTMVRVGTALFQ